MFTPKKRDMLTADLLIYGLAFLWLYYVIDRAIIAAVIAVPVLIFFKCFYLATYARYLKTKKISIGELLFRISAMTIKEQTDFLSSLIPESLEYSIEDRFIKIKKLNEDILIGVFIKFNDMTFDDLLQVLRKVRQLSPKKTYIITKNPLRQTMVNAKRLGLSIQFVRPRELRDVLVKHNAIPPSPAIKKGKKEKTPFVLRDLLATIFNRKKSKYYLLSAIILGATSFLVPLTEYYLVLCAISSILALCSVFAPE